MCRADEMEKLEMLEASNDIVGNVMPLPTLPAATGFKRRHCIHSLDAYTLADGSTVYLSSVMDARLYRDWIPDIGIYFDGSWDRESESFTYLLPWQDYGLPLVTMSIFKRYIVTALEHIDNDETVDIGCMGGHGRTGTFLACLDIASDNGNMATRDAIAKVRRDHCFSAIETREQEWFIDCFRAFWRGEPEPEKPVAPVKPSGNSYTVKRYEAGTTPSDSAYSYHPGDVYESTKRYAEDYVWERPDEKDKGRCIAYTNPTTGTRWLLDIETNRWEINPDYVATEKD